MKKILTISILILAIVTSLLAGTLSYYTTSIDKLAGGSVTAKEFIFVGGNSQDSFIKDAKIAPGESIKWSFEVMNHDKGIVTETVLYYKLTFTLFAADGKDPILPLQAKIRDKENGEILATVTHDKSQDIVNSFQVSDHGQSRDYFVEFVWPHTDKDYDYRGSAHGSSLKVSAIASQKPFTDEPTEPDLPDENEGMHPGEGEGSDETGKPVESNIHVIYKTGKPNYETLGNGEKAWRYQFWITIQNNSDVKIDGWKLAFFLRESKLQKLYANYRLDDVENQKNGYFSIMNPQNYDVEIPANGAITGINGHFIALDGTAHSPENLELNGIPVTWEHIQGK